MPEVITHEVKSKQQEWLEKADVKWLANDGILVPPKDYVENLKFRWWVASVVDKGVDDDHRIKYRINEQCKRDINFYFNAFLWTQDPRRRPADLPFITYDYEDTYIRWVTDHIVKKLDCLTEKSRDMGMSWTLVGILLHCWNYQPGFLSHIGSKKEDDVDRSGDIRSLFEKLRYILRRLPSWLRPYEFNWKKHSMFMRLINPQNENSITGESSNRDFGRAGRYSCVMLDEFAYMEYAEEAWTATGDSSPCRIAVSTPNGTGNKFWQLRWKSKIDTFTAHWSMHPTKAEGVYLFSDKEKTVISREEAFESWRKGEKVRSPWYDQEEKRRLTDEKQSKVDLAQELDIDYLVSGNPYFDIPSLKKQKEWRETTDFVNFGRKPGVIIGNLTEIDGKIEFRPTQNGWLRVFEVPRQSGQYVAGLDPASGGATADYSAGAWRDKRTRNLVAGVYGHFDYDELSYYGYLVSKWFNNAYVCAESGGYGSAVNKRLYDLGANVARTVDLSTGAVVEKDKLGFFTSSKTRPLLLGDIAAEIREEACELRDKDLITECFNFIVKDAKPQASEGANDDYILAFGIAGQLLRFRPYSVEQERNYKKRFTMFRRKPPANQGMVFKK